MAVEAETELSQEPIIRHYRGASRAEVEQAYRNEAAQAVEGGYLPVTHQWTTDWQGYLLAVTYRQSATLPRTPVASAPMTHERAQPATVVAPPVVGADVPATLEPEHFAPSQPSSSLDPYSPFAPQGADETPGGSEAPGTNKWPGAQETYASQPPAEPPTYAQSIDEPAVEQRAERTDEQAPQPAYAEVEPTYPQVEPTYAPVPLGAAPERIHAERAQPVQTDLVQPSPPRESASEPAPAGRSAKLTVQTLDLHCAGEPLRIIRSGFPDVPSMPVLERRNWVLENADHIRQAVIQEPRGHRDMYGAILLPPFSDYADMCVLFMHNEGYSTMCGHGIIAITTALIEEGLFPATEPVTTIRYEVPAGIVTANASTVQLASGDWAVQGVRFTNVPSYVAAQSLSVRPDGVSLHGAAAQYGALSVDLSFGGAYYGIVNAAELGLRVVPEQAEALRRAGAAITDVLRRDHTPSHPTDPDLSFVYGTIIVDLDPASSPDGRATRAHMRNATIFANAELDRSPCGSGTSAILAQLHARGRIKIGQEIINAGITGEHFLGRVEAETALGPYPAVSTSIAGTAYITGYATFIIDERDPLGEGFLLS